VPLAPKTAHLLLVLLQNRGHVVEREALLAEVWGDRFVGEGVLSVNVFQLRRALGGRQIETLARRGYRFAGAVRESVEDGTIRSIAVLPFKLLGAAGDDGYLGLGIADVLITRLSRTERLIVRPTSAVRGLTSLDQDAAVVARQLMVDALLEGTLRRSGGRVRMLIQLVDPHQPETLWAAQFDEPFDDLFRLEDRIAEQVVAALRISLGAAARRRLEARPTESTEAYRLYLQGRYFWNKRTAADLARGVEYFRRAIEIDPRFALAHCGLADSHLLGANAASPAEAMRSAKAAVLRALEIDERSGEAHASLGRIKMCFDWDWHGAGREFERAQELAPNYPTAHQWHANYLVATGDARGAAAAAAAACELEPCSPILHAARGWVHYMARDHDAALAHYRRALEMDPHLVQARRELAMVYEQRGELDEAVSTARTLANDGEAGAMSLMVLAHVLATAGETAEARAVMAALRRRARRGYVAAHVFAVLHAALGEESQALVALERACAERSSPLVWAKADPWLDGLRAEPRFRAVLRRVGLG
jgi:serine/threonine-protein kinase